MAKHKSISQAVRESDQYRIRMFKSDFLEKFSYVHPLVPVFLYVPVILVSSYFAFAKFHLTPLQFAGMFLAGILGWTLTEYTLHRFLFHPPMKSEFLKKVYFYTHGIHHEAPLDATRLVMPPSVSVPLAVLVYFGVMAIWPQTGLAFYAGFILGYLFYDMLHFSTHFFAFPWKWYKLLKKHHMVHHFKAPDKNFGVSNHLWDYIFRTKYKHKSLS
ncbi:MAG: fatty acid hydroxylase, partial [Candidatus Hydrogenedentota bacterium]